MAIKNRRLAGMRLAGRPDVDVTEQLRIAQEKLKAIQPDPNAGLSRRDRAPKSLSHEFDVDGHRIRLNASANTPYLGEINLEEGKQYFGNRQTFEELSQNPPEVEYGLTWSVDGSYDSGMDMSPQTRVKIARQVQREWDKLFKQMPENALVANSPVGASQGDYGRADLYMGAGFGPVQDGGSQYGIVHKGKVHPLSPQGVDSNHGQHLAKRARMAGDVDLSEAILSANKQHQELLRLPWDGDRQPASNAKGGGYDGYDGYDNEDYEPPVRPEDLRQVAKGSGWRRGEDGVIPEIARREAVLDEISRAGLDRGDRNARWPGRDSTERSDFANFEPSPDEIGEFRNLQVELLNDPNYNAIRNVADVFNRQFPRPLPQRLDAPPERYGYRSREINSVADLDRLPPVQRRDAAIELIRDELDQRVRRQGMDYNQFPQKQASLKHAMVETDELVSDLLNNGSITQELYRDSDVAALRELQAAVAGAGGMRPDYESIAERGVSSEDNRRRRRRFRTSDAPQQTQGRGINGEVVDLPSGDVTTDRRILSDEQQLQRRMLTPPNTADVSGLDMSVDSSIEGINGWFGAQGPAGDMYRNMYGNNVQELTAGLQANPNMSDSAVRQILHSATTQPGRFDREEVGRAYLTMLQRGGGAQPVVSANPTDIRNAAILAELAQSDRGPMGPIRRNPMAPNQMSVEVPGVGTLRRPNQFIPTDGQLLPAYLQPRQDTTPRQAQPSMAVAPQGTGRLFDDLLDAQVDARINRPQPDRPALQRGPEAGIMAERQQRLAAIRGERSRTAPISWNDAPLIPGSFGEPRRPQPARSQATRLTQPSDVPTNPVLPSPPTTIYRADGSIEGGTMRDQMAYLDSVQRAVLGQPPRQPTARQMQLSLPETGLLPDAPTNAVQRPGRRIVRYEDAPEGMNLSEFLQWRDAQGGVSPVYGDDILF